ncbi:MAG: hypothetical protein EOP10_08880, partial [Proteobacteria bacterium]
MRRDYSSKCLIALSLLGYPLGSRPLFAQDKEHAAEPAEENVSPEKSEPKTFPLKKKKKKARKPAKWNYEQSYRLLGTGTFSEVNEEKVNPDNAVYQLPTSSYLLEFRPEVVGTFRKTYKFVLRPRAYIQLDNRDAETAQFDKQKSTSEAFVNEAYFAVSPNAEWQYVVGTQNFQWGPAELASPSNPFFRDLGLEKTYFFETRGRAMVRVNYSPSGQLSIIALGEPTDNGAERPEADEKFHKRALIKIEYSDQSQTNYLGITSTATESDRAEFGAYGNYEIATALTTYFDMMNRVGSKSYYPVVSATSAAFEKNLFDDDTRYTTALLGLRYVTERNWDFRLEGFYDQTGWTEDQRERAVNVLIAQQTAEAVRLYLAPGSFFPGQKFVYGSLRIPDWGWKDSLTLSLRNFHSLSDNTEKLQATLDTFLSDHL